MKYHAVDGIAVGRDTSVSDSRPETSVFPPSPRSQPISVPPVISQQTNTQESTHKGEGSQQVTERACVWPFSLHISVLAIPVIQTSLYCIFTHYWHFFSSRDTSGSSPTTSSCHHSLSPFYTNKHRYAPTSHGIYHRLENFHVKNSSCKKLFHGLNFSQLVWSAKFY